MALPIALPSTSRTPWGYPPCNISTFAGKPKLSFTPLVSVSRPLASHPPRLRVSASSSNSDDKISPAEISSATSLPSKPDANDVRSAPTERVTDSGGQTQSSATSSAGRSRRSADSTDWIASAVTRRFGIGAGLAWVGFLAFGVVSEQIKTRREVFLEESNTRDVEDAEETVLPNGVRFIDLRVGGGAMPQKGDLVLVSLTGRASLPGQAEPVTFIDTSAPGARDLVFSFGVRPFAKGMTEGLVSAMATMRAGGRRNVFVPADRGNGQGGGETIDSGVAVPDGATLEYVIELKRVSIPPS
ncbi:hypothetical protein CLOM_g23823 [Closterium sp. NIES-68]|nr:hypothetical protein CLOM_g23823 [Closterium sp. NIES-68]GJP71992.1 hypothetical protein CLOP_g2770 [Closterium sp. NIES-67]